MCYPYFLSLHLSLYSALINSSPSVSLSSLPLVFIFHTLLKFFDRLKLFGMPAKHQPDFIYLRHVPLRKVHLFTVTQLTCLVLLWVIKTSPAAIVFPMMVSEPPPDSLISPWLPFMWRAFSYYDRRCWLWFSFVNCWTCVSLSGS